MTGVLSRPAAALPEQQLRLCRRPLEREDHVAVVDEHGADRNAVEEEQVLAAEPGALIQVLNAVLLNYPRRVQLCDDH